MLRESLYVIFLSHTKSRCSDTMYDFCFGPLYAALLGLGGIAGWATKGSVPSLVAGLASAGVISLCSYSSLQSYHAGKTCKPATLVSLVVAVALTYMMYQRYSSTGKLMPAGMVAGISGGMAVFYAWSLFLGPTPKLKH